MPHLYDPRPECPGTRQEIVFPHPFKSVVVFLFQRLPAILNQIAAATNRPAQIIGTHFFNPPVLMRLIEVVRGLETSDKTVARTLELAQPMGKEVVISCDSQGFIASRLINLWCNEAERIVEEGIATAEDVDKACRLAFNHPMGPMEISDFCGLDMSMSAGCST